MQHRRHQTRGGFIGGILFCLLSCYAVYALDSVLLQRLFAPQSFPVQGMELTSPLHHVTPEQLKQALGPQVARSSLLTLDVNRVQELTEQLPWVSQVKVTRQLPGFVVLDIEEHVASARWNEHGLYDAAAQQVFYPDAADLKVPLVALGGPQDELAAQVYSMAVLFARTLQGYGLQMSEVLLDNIHCYHIKLTSGCTLVLGRDADTNLLMERLNRFLKAREASGLDLSKLEYVELRYDSGFSVKARETQDNKKGPHSRHAGKNRQR